MKISYVVVGETMKINYVVVGGYMKISCCSRRMIHEDFMSGSR